MLFSFLIGGRRLKRWSSPCGCNALLQKTKLRSLKEGHKLPCYNHNITNETKLCIVGYVKDTDLDIFINGSCSLG